MKSLGKFPDPFWAEIAAQPAAMRRAAESLTERALLLETVRERGATGPVVFTGMGASYAACYVPVTLLAARGRSATMVDAAELVHYRRPILTSDTLLVVISQSGQSAEVVRLMRALDHGVRPFVASITNGTRNALAHHADIAFDTHVGRELGPSTATFGTTLVALAAIAEVLSGGSVAETLDAVGAQTEGTAAAMDVLVERSFDLGERLVSWLGGRRTFVILGRGTARAASEMAALLLKETARLPAESLEAAQFRHGPLELAGPELAAAVIATEGPTRDLELVLARDLVDAQAAVLVVGGNGDLPKGIEHLPLAHVGRALAPALAVIPFQLLAWRLAVERGRSPGRLTRASKVTIRE